MKNTKKIISLFALIALLSGCETATQAYSMSQQGNNAFSCDEISKAFSAYKRDRNSQTGLAVLVPLMANAAGVDTRGLATSSDQYYEQAKATVNIARMVQGCPAIY